ncbi:Alpha/Beta hydrolase protein [Aspergillus pseudodeflectus]|uniref:Alpha/Beta hydrolase protein n=1 Tax=Aspergillus pseudodeflectus TaxID=176178 RepID=A0ABR4L646_9EURO
MASLIPFATALLALTNTASAAPSNNRGRSCVTFDIAVPVTAENSIYETPRVDSNIDAVDWIWDLETWTSPNITERIKGVKKVQDTFSINAQLCVPKDKKADKSGILQIATHGFAFDKQYWDSEIEPEKYSYVDAALKAGYSILTYDRLGVGKSSKPDAYEVVQGPVELEILKELTVRARSGDLAKSIKGKHADIPDFEKIVLVGHSLGSAVTIGVLSKYGEIVDGAISTGLITQGKLGQTGQSAFGLEHAKTHDKTRFGDRGSGYLVQATLSNVQQIFFKKGHFDEKLLKYGEKIKETGTIGEFLSLGSVLATPALNYKGPLLFALAEYDFGTCSGDCKGSYDYDAIRNDMFPAASDVEVHIQEGSGHALTMHHNATGHFEAIFGYLDAKGL